MLYRKTTLLVLLLNLTSTGAWALGEQAGEVISLIEAGQAAPIHDETAIAERAARISAARKAAALKKAEERAAAERREKERAERTAERKIAEQRAPEVPAPAQQERNPAGQTEKTAELKTPEPAPSAVKQPSPSRSETGGQTGEAPPAGRAWWATVTDMVGLTSADPGMIAQNLPSSLAPISSDYIIGPGDVIGISVWRDDTLTRTVVVLPDGRIAMPLVGELQAEGKTVAQLKQDVEKALSRFTADSNVTVEVKQSNSMIIYITGRVNTPGRQVLLANTNVLQALAMAGGPNPFAQSSKISIFRQNQGKTTRFAFNYNEVMEGRHLESNIELKRGDVIIVP